MPASPPTPPTPASPAPRRRAPAAGLLLVVGLAALIAILALALPRPAPAPRAPDPSVSTVTGAREPGSTMPGAAGPTPGRESAKPPAAPSVGAGAAAAPENPNELPPDHPEVEEVPEGTQVTIQWLGHACFYFHSPGGAAAVADPFDGKSTGLSPPETGAHLVTVSADDPRHGFTGAIHAFEGEAKQVVRGREARVKDLRVAPVATSGGRFAYVYETAGMRIAHLGDLREPLGAEQAKRLGAVDILLVPVGGEGITPKQAVEVTKLVAPKIVVPMAYSTPSMLGPDSRLRPVEEFISASPYAVTNKEMDTILVGKSQLPKSTEIYTLRLRQ